MVQIRGIFLLVSRQYVPVMEINTVLPLGGKEAGNFVRT